MNDYKLYGFNSEEEYEQAIAEEQKAEEERQAEKENEEGCHICKNLSDAQPVFIDSRGVDMSFCPNCGRDMSIAIKSR